MIKLRRFRAVTLIELLVCISIVAIVLGIAIGGIGGCSNSEGSRVGVVNKFSRKGLTWKTYEGTLIVGGVQNRPNAKGGGYNSVAANWDFTVKDKSLIPAIESAMDSGHRVKLSYKQVAAQMPWNGETSYFVTAVKDLDADSEGDK